MVRTLLLCSTALYAVPTFHKDVQPILQKHCVSCHRPGEIGPMALRTYQEVRPWAAAIQQAVKLEKMPPWGASPAHGRFSNDPTLTATEKETINNWIAAKTPEGDPKDAPKPRVFVDGWNIKTPELVFEMPAAFDIPASGTVDYTYIVLPTNFTEDRWIQSAEVRPGDRARVHHVIVYVREPGSPYLRDAKPGVPYVPTKGSGGGTGEYLVGFTPGKPAMELEPGKAKLIKAGSDLVFQMHYTTNGKAGSDRTKVGFNFAKSAPKERVMTVSAVNGTFAIPAGAADHPVDSKLEFTGPAHLVTMWPHMHVRGKSMRFELVDKGGQRQTLLDVPKYDFNWQMRYVPEEPLKLDAGSVIQCFAKFDNSPNNKHNPDPTKVVRWGDQSWEEMMIGFMEISFDAKLQPSDVVRRVPRARAAAE
jgi:hypothetical protein